MIYRVVNEERMDQVRELWDYCFEKQDTPFFQYYFNEYCGKNNMVIGGYSEAPKGVREKLRTMVHINPYMLRIRGREQLVPYLVGVATAPEARGQHLVEPLFETTFEVLRSEGFTFATLMPIQAGIYLPYEFAYCYYRHGYELPLAELGRELAGAQGKELAVERLALRPDAEALAAAEAVLATLYAQLTSRYNGVPLRTHFQWNKLLTVHALEGMQCAVVYRKEQPCGYMFYYIAEDCLTIHELMAVDFAARNRLLQYVAMHQSSAESVKWLATYDDSTYLGFANQKLTGTLEPFMMARCLDARKALLELTVSADMPAASVVLLLTDKLINRNNHLVKLQLGPGELNVKSTLDAEEIIMDMGAFTQLYFGAYNASELYAAGRIRVQAGAEEKLTLLDKLFPKCTNFINEYF
ncbi:MAG: GNAT family N-acetyltransferase [Phascolarctobacterium sp.]|nr:GNAT family N-acetyltransferase [Phascolarctobacterium sp.]